MSSAMRRMGSFHEFSSSQCCGAKNPRYFIVQLAYIPYLLLLRFSKPEVRQPLSRKQLGEFHFFAKHDDRKGHHYYTPAPQAEAGVYSSDDPCGHHGVGDFAKI